MISKYLNRITEYFPDWTLIYKDKDAEITKIENEPNRDNLENVQSTGGRFIYSFAKFLDNIDNIIQDIIYTDRLYVDGNKLFEYEGLRLNKIDYISKIPFKREDYYGTIDGETTYKIQSMTTINNEDINEVTSIYHFFASSKIVYYYNISEEMLYFNEAIDAVKMNGITLTCAPHHVWGPYDEIGLLIGLERQPNEDNLNYSFRLREQYKKLGNSSPEKLKSYIYRALIPFTSTLPEDIIDLQMIDEEFVLNNIPEGKISDELKGYIELSKKVNKNYTNSYWDIIEINNMGLKYLPISWHLTDNEISEGYIQNGVLTPDSLEIIAPELELHPGDIDFSLTVSSVEDSEEEYYPETKFSYTLINQEEVKGSAAPREEYQLGITAYESVNLEFDLIAKLTYDNITSTIFEITSTIFEINEKDGSFKGINTTNKTSVGGSNNRFDSGIGFNNIDTQDGKIKCIKGTEVIFKDEDADNAKILIKLKSNDDTSPIFKQLKVTMTENEESEEIGIGAEEILKGQNSDESVIWIDKQYNVEESLSINSDGETTIEGIRLSDAHYKLRLKGGGHFNNGKFFNTEFNEGNGGLGFKLLN